MRWDQVVLFVACVVRLMAWFLMLCGCLVAIGVVMVYAFERPSYRHGGGEIVIGTGGLVVMAFGYGVERVARRVEHRLDANRRVARKPRGFEVLPGRPPGDT